MCPSFDQHVKHTSNQFEADLEEIHRIFMGMGGMVEQQVADAVHSLLDADAELAIRVQQQDQVVNKFETDLDGALALILVRRQPTANDLRTVLAMSKANTDLERIGDEASKIARIAQALVNEGESTRGYMETRHIGNQVRLMIREALDAFARLDAEQALRVMQADADIDREYQSATRTLMTFMMEDPRQITRVMNVLWVLRSLERMGDHARNISEQVIYMVKGRDVRHTHIDMIEQQLHQD